MAFVIAVQPKGTGSRVRSKVKWYIVIHRFDAEGNHLNTAAEFLGIYEFASQVRNLDEKLKTAVQKLGTCVYGDVFVKMFSTHVDGEIFGLVDASEPDEGYLRVDLVPNGLSFFPPWDGSYST